MKDILPLHTATGNTAYETCLLSPNFPQGVALVMVNVFLSEPCLGSPLAILGENVFPKQGRRAASTQLVPLQSGVGSAPWLSPGSQELLCPEEGLIAPSWKSSPFLPKLTATSRVSEVWSETGQTYVDPCPFTLPPSEEECCPVKGRVDGRILLPAHCQPRE